MHEEEDEVTLLDGLVVVAENLKVLLLGPLVVGLLALAISYASPQSFLSTCILSPPASPQTPVQAIAVMVSPLVLDRVIGSLKLADGRSLDVARAGLARQIKATVGKDGLVRLDVTANAPIAARDIAYSVIDNWLLTTVPQASELAELQARLEYAQASLSSVRNLLDRLMSDSSNLNRALTRGEAGLGLVALGELQARYFTEVLTIPRTMRGLSRDVIVQPPTLPAEPAGLKKALIALLATVAGGFVTLLWVFARQAWRTAAMDPKSAEKQARLSRSLGFKS